MRALGDRGYFRVGSFRGAPVRVHWTTPIGAYVFCGFGLAPIAWGAFVVLILAHEVGHALLVKSNGLAVESIDVHGVGGECRYVGWASDGARARIAWGGVLAQVALLIAASWLAGIVAARPYLREIVQTWTATNVLLIALNLLPIAPFDGAEAWRLFHPRRLAQAWKRGGREGNLRRKEARLEKELARIRREQAKPPDRSMLN